MSANSPNQSPIEDPQPWHEAKLRFCFAGQVTAVVICIGWLAWFFPYDDWVDRSGTPLGGDYVMLYVAGQVVADGESELLYDDARNQLRTSELFPEMDSQESWPYRYPPTVAAAMIPLAQLPLAWSYALFFLIQLGLLSISLWLLVRDHAVLRQRAGWLWAIAGSPLILESLIGGQSSLLALACTVGFLHFLQRGQDPLAGAVLALLLYKPNVAALLIIAALIVRPKLLIGFLPTAAVGLGVAWFACGWSSIARYIQLATELASGQWGLETPYWKVHGLAPLLQQLLPLHGKLVCALLGLVASVFIGCLWRQRKLNNLQAVAVLLSTNALFNPYVPIYDLVLLELALVLACQVAYHSPIWRPTLTMFYCAGGVLFVGPHLSQALARPLGWQFFPLLLSAMLVWVGLSYRQQQQRSHRDKRVDDMGGLFTLGPSRGRVGP